MIRAIALILMATLGNTSTFNAVDREASIARAIQTLRGAAPRSIDEYAQFVDDAEKNQCRSLFEILTTNCMQLKVKQHCSSMECQVISDIAIVNKVNERLFLSREERFKISVTSAQYGPAYGKALLSKYAVLATEYLLLTKEHCGAEDLGCLARHIDGYCQRNADVKSLPWQGCVSAIIWFVGISK